MAGLYQTELLSALEEGVRSMLNEWQLSSQTELKLLCISENATFLINDPSRESSIVTRVHRPSYHSKREIESELEWIAALRQSDIVTTPKPLPLTDNRLIAEFDYDGETRHVVAFEFMPGEEPDESGDLTAGFKQLGAITARLHTHARQWHQPDGFIRKVWNFDTTLGDLPHWGDWREALGLNTDGKAVLAECIALLETQLHVYGCSSDRFGLIHADLRLANLLIDGDQMAVIDFDDCGFGWYMYDFAAAISFIETSPQISVLQDAWVDGYRTVADLSEADVNALPMFVILRRLLLTAWIASHAETPTAQALGTNYTEDSVLLAKAYLEAQE